MSDIDFKYMVMSAREQLSELRHFFKDTHGWSFDDFHQYLAKRLKEDFDTPVSTGWVRDQCDIENKTDPSFVKMGAILQFLQNHHPEAAVRVARDEPKEQPPEEPVSVEPQQKAHEPQQADNAPREQGNEPQRQVKEAKAQGNEPRAADHGAQEEKINQVLAQDTEEKRLRPFKDPNRASWAVATIANRAIERQKKAGGQVGTLIDCALIYCQFRYDVKMSHMPLQSLRQAQTKELAKTLKIALPNAIALYNVLFDFLHNAHFPWGRDEDIQAEIETVQKAMEDEAKVEAKRLAKKQRPKTNAQMIRAIKGTAVKQKRLEKTA